MPWPCMKTIRSSRWTRHQQSSASTESRYIHGYKKYGTGKRARTKALHDKAQAANDSERIRQLEKENAKLREERDILRKAAKDFA